ncbi:hypothetical protein SDC9_129405 [bioreactor metagenome]|uniref:Uncharacterized protein n=1 Tax=bioreactor metagenome TaxID=1076179 RepID=A0A645CZE4_9ZZZZ
MVAALRQRVQCDVRGAVVRVGMAAFALAGARGRGAVHVRGQVLAGVAVPADAVVQKAHRPAACFGHGGAPGLACREHRIRAPVCMADSMA